MTAKLIPYGDHAILIQWPAQGFSISVSDHIHGLTKILSETEMFTEVVPGYDSILCVFDLSKLDPAIARQSIETCLNAYDQTDITSGKTINISVQYGGENGPDMQTICESSGLSEDEVIALHSRQEYRVCMMGFIPGFTFLSPAPEKLHHPRLATPRAKVPAGSIGIANWQTGIYGLESPGGWQIIGRTTDVIFDANRDTPFLLNAGDNIRFVPQ